MLRILEKQFKKPKGFFGRIISMLMRKENNFIYDKIIEELDIKEKENIFEIGYGHGIGIAKILSKNDCYISGIDFSELMNKEASKRNEKYICNGKATLYFGDFLKYDLNKSAYDKIICINVIYFWDILEIPFTKIRDGLKENGLFYLYMDHPNDLSKYGFNKNIFNMYTIDQVVDKLSLSGFNEINYQFEKGYYIKCKKNRA